MSESLRLSLNIRLILIIPKPDGLEAKLRKARGRPESEISEPVPDLVMEPK